MFNSSSWKNNRLWRERRTVGSFLLFCTIYFGITMVVFWIFCLAPLYQVVRSRSWVACPAVVMECSRIWKSHEGKSGYMIHIRYEYFWQNQKMEGDRYDFFFSRSFVRSSSFLGFGSGNKLIREIVGSFPPGKKIECLVNPENPSEAVVTRSIPWGAWKSILVPLILLLAGIYIAQKTVRDFFKKKQPPTKEIQETKEQS